MSNGSATHIADASLTRQTTAVTVRSLVRNRAHRLRRKDPSCDDCRKRKVRCDATHTSNCSECLSHGFKCKFTKQVNRGTPPLQHIQDLKGQLALAKQQISQMRTLSQDNSSVSLHEDIAHLTSLNSPEPAPGRFTSTPPVKSDIAEVLNGTHYYGQDCSNSSSSYHQNGPLVWYPHVDIPLPPRYVANKLWSQYHRTVHVYAPHLHWPTFQRELEELYHAGTFKGVASAWTAVFFAVLACGTLLNRPDDPLASGTEGKRYAQLGTKSIDSANNDPTLNHVRANLLFSIYHVESNVRSAGNFWLAAAVSIAQDLGLNNDQGPHNSFDAEMRKRVWWAVCTWDRTVALETDKLLLINDEDCEASEPSLVTEGHIQQSGIPVQPALKTAANGMVAIIPVVRLTDTIKKVLRFRAVSATTLEACDGHFDAIMASYPEPFPINSTADLYPCLLPAVNKFLHTASLF